MSDSKISKSDTELSSNSSWSVIDESDESRRSSVENIFKDDSDNSNNGVPLIYQDGQQTEDTFISVPEESTVIDVEGQATDGKTEIFCVDDFPAMTDNINVPENVRSKGKRPKKPKAEPLSVLSIAASVLTITGITLLCMLFPQNLENEALNKVERNYIDIITLDNANFQQYLNKTSETLDLVNKSNLLQNITETVAKETASAEDLNTECLADEQTETIQIMTTAESQPVNFNVPTKKESLNNVKEEQEQKKFNETDLVSSFQQLQNKTMGLIKDLEKVLMNPNLQIFLCTLMQDICLIKLVKQLNKPPVQKKSSNLPKSQDNTKTTAEKQTNVKKAKKTTSLKRKLETKMKTIKKKASDELPNASSKSESASKKLHGNISEHIFISSVNGSVNRNSELFGEMNSCFKFRECSKPGNENGKSECERRFEELDTKWETAGQNHRQKVLEIKENFKNEVQHIKEQEKESSQRKKRINLVREKYIDRLKLDREKYLYQLRKLRDEHHKIMRELCLRKHNDVDLKDASVGNYAVLLPDTYDFQQKLELLRNRENKSQVVLQSQPPAPFPKLDAIRYKNFTSFPNIPSQGRTKKEEKKNSNLMQIKREKYIERIKRYYDKKEKYLKKKAALATSLNKTAKGKAAEKVENFTENPFDDIVSHMISTISESKSKFYKSFSNSSIETVKDNSTKSPRESSPSVSANDLNAADQIIAEAQVPVVTISSQEFKLVVRKKPKKRDLYDVAFDDNSKKIKHDDMVKWNAEKKIKIPLQLPIISKQDPQKSYKEKIVVKGHM